MDRAKANSDWKLDLCQLMSPEGDLGPGGK